MLSWRQPPRQVAPFTGAWIEMGMIVNGRSCPLPSLPLRGRGLKSLFNISAIAIVWSLPLRGRGLKYSDHREYGAGVLSLPLRGRGLK